MAINVQQPWVKGQKALSRPRRRRRAIGLPQVALLLLILCASTAVGYLGYQRFSPPRAAAQPTTLTPVRRGAISATANLSGSTAAVSLVKLAFDSAGQLTELPVKLGDEIRAGAVLARLDTSDLELQVAQASVTLEQAKLKLAQLKEGPKQVEVAAAQANYDSTVAKYNDLKDSPHADDVVAAQTAVRDAEVALTNGRDNLIVVQKSSTVSKDVRDRQNEHNWFEAQYGDTLAKLKRGQASQGDVDRDYANLLTAKERLDSAIAAADLALRKAETDVTKAGEALDKAKESLRTLLIGPSSDQLKTAEALMLNAQSQLEAKTAGSSSSDVAAQEVAVRLAEATLKQKQLLVEKAVLRAPFDGVVDSISINAGEQVVAAKEVLTLVNLKQFQINARVDETEVARVATGQTAMVTLDAIPDQRFAARITSIGATAVVQQGVVIYPIVLQLQANGAAVRPGMTASIVVEVARRDDALLVPNRAIRTQGRNRTVVVAVNGQQETRAVGVGMTNDQYTEVTTGLAEGEQVVIPETTTAAPRVPQTGFGGLPGGPGVQGGFGR